MPYSDLFETDTLTYARMIEFQRQRVDVVEWHL